MSGHTSRRVVIVLPHLQHPSRSLSSPRRFHLGRVELSSPKGPVRPVRCPPFIANHRSVLPGLFFPWDFHASTFWTISGAASKCLLQESTRKVGILFTSVYHSSWSSASGLSSLSCELQLSGLLPLPPGHHAITLPPPPSIGTFRSHPSFQIKGNQDSFVANFPAFVNVQI